VEVLLGYNKNIPNAREFFNKSQTDLLNNFLAIYNAFSKNHVEFNSPEEGNHSYIELSPQVSKPSAPDLSLLFSALVGGSPEVFYSSNESEPKQVTNTEPISSSPTKHSWDFVSGLKLRFGSLSLVNASSATLLFSEPFPNASYANYVSPTGTMYSTAIRWVVNSYLTTGVKVDLSSKSTISFNYLSIGN
jgi:hypothetical protein